MPKSAPPDPAHFAIRPALSNLERPHTYLWLGLIAGIPLERFNVSPAWYSLKKGQSPLLDSDRSSEQVFASDTYPPRRSPVFYR